MKLALGTAQFGMNYGINNKTGQISKKEACQIVGFAKDQGIKTFDTAISYGNSEEYLGSFGLEGLNIITKLPSISKEVKNPEEWIVKSTKDSLRKLNVKKIHGILLHHPENLFGRNSEKILRGLEKIKSYGLVKKIGLSVYSPFQFEEFFKIGKFDIVQCPFNLVDQRLKTSGWLNTLHEKKIEIHTRSIFLQGLLLMQKREIPKEFNPWKPLFDIWHDWLKSENISPIQACISFALSNENIDKVVIGVDSLLQLKEIISLSKKKYLGIFPNIMSEDLPFINPSYWNTK